jgi:hypothetical protein
MVEMEFRERREWTRMGKEEKYGAIGGRGRGVSSELTLKWTLRRER